MKNLLIGLLALGSISAFADDQCKFMIDEDLRSNPEVTQILSSKGYTFDKPQPNDNYIAITRGTRSSKNKRFISNSAKQVLQITHIVNRKEWTKIEITASCRTRDYEYETDVTKCENKTIELIQKVPECLIQ